MFDTFISLGYFCGTAASMSKHGLRGSSGPFDWVFSDFDGVIRTIDNDFKEFISEDCIQFSDDDPLLFMNPKYGIQFVHELRDNYNDEIDSVRKTYLKRIERFKNERQKGKVCFIRAVRDQEEIDYIRQNTAYIKEVLGRSNEIIYLIPEFLNIPDDLDVRYYTLPINRYNGNSMDNLRELFDVNEEFLSYCIDNICAEARRSNLIFDSNKEHEESIIEAYKVDEYKWMTNLDRSNFTPDIKVDIYGVSDRSKAFCDYIKDYVNIRCFIDKASSVTSYNGIPVITPDGYTYAEGTTIVNTSGSGYYKTCLDISNICKVPLPDIIDLIDFLHLYIKSWV